MRYEIKTVKIDPSLYSLMFLVDIPDNAVGITVNPKLSHSLDKTGERYVDVYYYEISYLVPVEESHKEFTTMPELIEELHKYGRITYLEDDVIDEMVLHNASVHLELLDDACYMLIVDNGIHHWHLNIFSKSGRAHVVARMLEDNSVKG